MPKLDYLKIKERRNELDIKQREVSEATGININHLKSLELGKCLTNEENIAKICDFLKLDMNEIYKPDFRETKVISIVNNKGGCGKTSVASSLGCTLAEMNYKVLLIDTDCQRNLSTTFNMDKYPDKHFGLAILNDVLLDDFILHTEYENIDIIVSDVSMATLDLAVSTKMHKDDVVAHSLANIVKQGIYDFIIMDTNPNLSLVNFNVINASDCCIIPVQPLGFDVDGIFTLIDFINDSKKYNPNLEILGIVINKYDSRNKKISTAAIAELKKSYSHLLFDTILQTDVKIQNAQWENSPVNKYSSNARITKEYKALTKEVIKRCRALNLKI